MIKKGIAITLVLALIAELYRFHGLLLIDLWVPVFTVSAATYKIRKKKLTPTKLIIPAALFVTLGFGSLLINSGDMSWREFLESTFYGIRWASFFLLSLLVANEKPKVRKEILHLVFIFAALLAIAGLIQLRFVPNFTEFEDLGWDPHQDRLLATWFDPNFVGGFFAFILPIVIGYAWDNKKSRTYLVTLTALLTAALALTLSRSAYLAFIAGMIVFGLLRSWKFLGIMGMSILLLIAASGSIQDRIIDLGESIGSVFNETYTLPDPSARLRFGSWQEAWTLFQENPVFGQGYNRYEHAALELGTIKDTEIHSASGSDSSLLTILATTGLAGLLPFLTIYLILALQSWQNRKSSISLGFLAALAGLFIHSIFVNSLLFPLFMAPFWIIVGTLNSK